MECQWNKSLEATSFVLQGTQLEQVVHAIFIIFDVTVEHCRIRLQADLMGQLRGIEPLIAVNFVVADDMAYTIGKNLRTSARK